MNADDGKYKLDLAFAAFKHNVHYETSKRIVR